MKELWTTHLIYQSLKKKISISQSTLEKKTNMSSMDFVREKLWREQGKICLYCKNPLKGWWSEFSCIDHIYPKSLGGTSAQENLALVCYPCNSLKSDFTSIHQVIVHFIKMFVLFWRIIDVDKVEKAMKNGRMNRYGRERFPNPISKMATPPKNSQKRGVRVEAYQKRVAAFQSIKSSSARSAARSEAYGTSVQNSR